MAMNQQATTDALLEMVFSMRSVPRGYISGALNTSTLALRVIGGDEKGSPKSETVKYVH
jgi:hypothetical protein